MPKGGWKEYLVFSKKERVAVFMLLSIIAVFISLSFFYTPVFTSPVIDKDVQQKLTALSASNQTKTANAADNGGDSALSTAPTLAVSAKPQKEQFYFDPNTLSVDGWKKLGFGGKTIDNIMHYRDEVAKFKTPEDLYNVPRIRKKTVEAVLPFVKIGLKTDGKEIAPPTKFQQALPAANPKAGQYKMINVNTAVADDFMVFPGMTVPVANRIIKFRTSLQGFSSIDDVAKTYGLPDATFRIMRPFLRISPE